MNCVVTCKSKVRAVGLVGSNLEQQQIQKPPLALPLQRVEQQTRWCANTWLQYLFANYYFANRDDIIDDSNNKYAQLTSPQNESKNDNICSHGSPILTQLQQPRPHNSKISSSLSEHAAIPCPNSPCSNRGALLIGYLREICADIRLKTHTTGPTTSKYDKKFGNYHNSAGNNDKFEDNATPLSIKKQYSLLLTLTYSLLLFVFISSKNAIPCSGFSPLMRLYDSGFIGYNYPYQSPTSPISNVPYRHNRARFLNYQPSDPLETLPTLMDSFTQDQTSLPPSSSAPTLDSWTSLLTNPFRGEQDTLDAHVKRILVPRVSGTPGNIQVRNYIINNLKTNGYTIELDEFTDSTPVGPVKFANIIASSNPKACRQLVLACHYDSKMMDGFLGATDSAVPCAMLLKISETFNKSFRSSDSEDSDSLGLRFIFFDGEEAFEKWSQTDSLYGSRHLAQKWNLQSAPSQCSGKNELSRIELFLLLDLIGTADTTFVMYNRQLKHHYEAMQKYEKAYLSKNGLTAAQVRRETAFKGRFIPLDFVEDDHVPFKQRGVPILSLLASPFPSVWHTVNDNYKAIDYPRTRRILHVLEEFVANYKKDPNS